VVYVLMIQLGLPGWVLVAAAVLLVGILPFALGTSLVERQRVTSTVPTPSSGLGSVAHHWLRWRKAAQGSVIAFAGLGVVTTGYMAMRTMGIGPLGTVMARGVLEEQDEIILADFENRTADSTLGVTITEALRIDLSQSQVVRLLRPATIEAARERMEVDPASLLDDALAREVALREGIKAVIVGEVGQLGQGYMLSASLIAPSGGYVLTAVRVRADSDDRLHDAVDRLSRQLRERIGESLRHVRASAPLERVTTSSLDALRVYSLARPLPQEQLIERLEEAVRIDSTFAMAYWLLAGTYRNAGRIRERNAAARRAFRYRDRLPLVQRYHVEALYYSYVEGDADKRISALRSVLELDPYNTSAMTNLGNSLQGRRRFAEAESLYIRARTIRPFDVHFVGAVRAQVGQGKYEEAETTLDLFAERFPGRPLYFDTRVTYAAARHDLEAAVLYLDSLELTQRESPLWRYRASLNRAWMALRGGKLSEAGDYLRQAISLQEQRGLPGACLDLAAFHLGRVEIVYRGNPTGGWRKVEEALELYPLDSMAPEERPYENLAIAAAMAGRADQARAWLTERLALGESGDLGRLQSHEEGRVSGQIALAERRLDDAISAYRAYHEGTGCTICAFPSLAHAYALADQPDPAIAFYERYLSTPYGAFFWPSNRLEEDAWNLPGTLKRLGELYEQRGDHDNAVRYYNEFVDLWRDADPELQPQVEEVRQRLALLVGEPGRN
jgi:tetratricopeptide (TPR) repeat protein